MKLNSTTKNCLALALIMIASALFLFSGSVDAQTTAPNAVTPKPAASPSPDEIMDDLETFRVESNLVVVPVSVTDGTGQPVQGLVAKDFQLWEQEKLQEITQIGDPEQVPLEIALLLDVSGSVDARFAFEQQAASRFFKQVLKTGDRATIFAIDKTPRLELPLGTGEAAAAKVMNIAPSKGQTAFYDTVIEAARYLAENTPDRNRRVIVVISDGEDNFSQKVKGVLGTTRETQNAVTPQARQVVHDKVLAEVQREVQKAEVAFYSLNPSGGSLRLNIISKRAQDGMEQLAAATGGTSFVPEKEENFEAVFRQIAAELRSQYLLQYYSSDDSPTGKYLRLKVAVPTRPLLRVRSRQGYYAKRK
jgi:Ca-activated chloride channel family protein